MSDANGSSPEELSIQVGTTQLGTVPQRKRHREGHIQRAYAIQRVSWS